MNYKLTVDDIRRVVDQHKDYKISITTDGLGTYVARIANAQAIEVAKVLLAEIDRLQENNDKLIEGLRFYADEKTYKLGVKVTMGSALPLHEPVAYDKGQRAREILKEIGVTDV